MSLIVDEGSVAAVNYAESFFFKKNVDLRFVKSEFMSFSPSGDCSNDLNISFILPRRSGSEIYHLDKLLMEVCVKLVDSDNKPPENNTDIGPVNNIIHSIFAQVELLLNNIPVNRSSAHYPFKAYIFNTLNFGGEVKSSVLSNEGYIGDAPFQFDSAANSGYAQRRSMFVENEDKGIRKYKDTGIVLTGKVVHDLLSCETPIIGGVEVTFNFTKSDPKFHLFYVNGGVNNDSKGYHLKVIKMVLHVPVSTLADKLYYGLNTKLEKEAVR